MTIGAKPLAVMIVVILFGGILLANGMGWWQTESTKEAATFTTGEFAGQANPADIRGSYTFGDVQTNFDVPASLLAEAFGIVTDDPQSYPVKSLETDYAVSAEAGFEIGTASVRLFVAFYKGLPYDLSTDIYVPESAASILSERPLTEEQVEYLSAHTVSAVPGTGEIPSEEAPVIPEATPLLETHEEVVDYVVKGKTTFAEILEWGVEPETVESILGMEMPVAKGVLIRDFCTTNTLSFETIKTALQAEVDKVKK